MVVQWLSMYKALASFQTHIYKAENPNPPNTNKKTKRSLTTSRTDTTSHSSFGGYSCFKLNEPLQGNTIKGQ